MDAERWQEIERLFHAALQAEPSRRAALLEYSCAGDEYLRHEVESLLAHHERAGSFIEKPAFASGWQASGSSQSSTATTRFAPGTLIAQYRVLAILGAGGMGVVYKAEDSKLGRIVALKFLPETLSAEDLALERFQREARAASALNHSNICTIYDIDEYEGQPFISMEYVEGQCLKDYIRERRLDSEEICKIGIQIADALSAAHSKGVVHRDIKPANIVVSAAGPVKVLDFGLVKLIDSQGADVETKSLTETHSVTGTLPYMSPEQLRGRAVDARTDIYALGMVLYEMATGRRPFFGETSPQLIDEILHSPPPLPREVNAKVAAKLEEIILKCLEKDPEDRFQTAKEVAVDLRRMTTASSVSQRVAAVPGKRSRRFAWVAVPAVLLAFLAVFLLARLVFQNVLAPPTRSLAVLPFVEESNDASTQYVGDGITEGVIDKLSEVPSLRVMSRSSAFRFRGKETDAQSAGKDLHVQVVLTGRIARQADSLKLSAELVNVDDGTQIWGRQFRYAMVDLSRAQDDLAEAVSDKLQLRLSQVEETRLGRRITDNSEAYQLYLQARYHLNQRTPHGVRKSIELFQQATERDPNFALAYAGLADAYIISANLGHLAPRESLPEAKAAATKALVLDPQLGEAHSALGQVKSHYDYDLPGAQIEFLKGIKYNSNYANGRLFYAGGYLTPMGRHSEAIAEMKKALELDPLSLPLNNLMGNTYLWAGDYNKAVQQFRSTVELDPTFPMTHFFFAACLEGMGKYDEAIAEVQKGELVTGEPPDEVEADVKQFRTSLQTGGPKAYWQKNLELTLERRAQSGTSYFPALVVAHAFAKVGDKDKAFEWLNRAYSEKDGNLTLIKSLPGFENLRRDPRFTDLLKRMGLPI